MFKKLVLILVAISILSLTACDDYSSASQQRKDSINARANAFAKAEAKYPIPQTNNFPLREALVKYTERQDLTNHPYYVYVLADTGNIIGYYVSQYQPLNINAFLSSTEDVSNPRGDGNIILTAPSLDGIYYGGAGASAESSGWIIFDSATDAMIILYGVKLFVADQPLKVEAKPITVGEK